MDNGPVKSIIDHKMPSLVIKIHSRDCQRAIYVGRRRRGRRPSVKRGRAAHTWKSDIMPDFCPHLCTLGGGREEALGEWSRVYIISISYAATKQSKQIDINWYPSVKGESKVHQGTPQAKYSLLLQTRNHQQHLTGGKPSTCRNVHI